MPADATVPPALVATRIRVLPIRAFHTLLAAECAGLALRVGRLG